MKGSVQRWTNESVLKFAAGREPVEAIVQAAREVALKAMDNGWLGPPFDPIRLAEMHGISVSPRADIPDARTVPVGPSRFVIEYNPTRPAARLRYSIAHEIAHTLFPDCGTRIRNRGGSHTGLGDEWQLETLCNIAAAELLMPLGSMSTDEVDLLDINKVSGARKRYEVSTEAVLIRLAHLSSEPCAVFVASRRSRSSDDASYSLDYVISSRTWKYSIARGTRLPDKSPVAECTAIGFTAKGRTAFPGIPERLRTECIGIPPHPGNVFPRVAGFLSSRNSSDSSAAVTYLHGNVLDPRGAGRKIITHVVSDATANWGGGGVAVAIKRNWPRAQKEFRAWASSRHHLKLGEVHFCEVDPGIEVASMVCQRGYGDSATPRIRYAALESALETLAVRAKGSKASIHMPRIGCGQAGGSWMLVQELVSSSLLAANLPVTVYDLPGPAKPKTPVQLSLAVS